jgi:hypothetical protein
MQKAQKEIEEIKKHCTFKPLLAKKNTMSTGNIHAYPPMSARSNSARKPIQDRLIAEVEKRKENREKIKREMDIKEME